MAPKEGPTGAGDAPKVTGAPAEGTPDLTTASPEGTPDGGAAKEAVSGDTAAALTAEAPKEEKSPQKLAAEKAAAEKAREEQERLASEFYAKFGLGKYRVKKAEVKDKPFEKKEGALKLYELHAEADMASHKEKNNGPKWYKDKFEAAVALFGLHTFVPGIIQFEGFDNGKLLTLVESLAKGNHECSFAGFKQMEKDGVPKEDIYGGNGVLNLLLAFQRAVAPLRAKGITYDKMTDYFIDQSKLAKDAADGKWKIDGKEVVGAKYAKITLKLDRRMVKVSKSGRQVEIEPPAPKPAPPAPEPAPPAPEPAPPAPEPAPPAPKPAPPAPKPAPPAPEPAPPAPKPAPPAPKPAPPAPKPAPKEDPEAVKRAAERKQMEEMRTALAAVGIEMIVMPSRLESGIGYAKIGEKRANISFNKDRTYGFGLVCQPTGRPAVKSDSATPAQIKAAADAEPVVKEEVMAMDLKFVKIVHSKGTFNEILDVKSVTKNPDSTYTVVISVTDYELEDKTVCKPFEINARVEFRGGSLYTGDAEGQNAGANADAKAFVEQVVKIGAARKLADGKLEKK